MYSDKKNVLQVVALLRAHGVRRVVLCPGSRNVPLVRAFSACPYFECHAVTDERSAGFFALGMADRLQAPVAVCCTSGSALLNLHPAVCEAFYRHVPLVVVSADRPAAWIGQMDGQTLPQPGVFGALVRRAVTLPEPADAEEEWYCNRLVNEALLEAVRGGGGPVHINLPISEPFFSFTVERLPEVRRIARHTVGDLGRWLRHELPRYGRCLVVNGQMGVAEAAVVAPEVPAGRVAWLTELLGNIPSEYGAIRGFDAALHACGENEKAALQPDLVITMGGHIVSKRLKRFLRTARPQAHWHVTPDGQVADLFCALTDVVETDVATFWQAVGRAGGFAGSSYPELWRKSCRFTLPAPSGHSSLEAVRRVMASLPAGSVLHLANSSAVRLAELFPLPAGVTVCCNRGVNGIEGSVSAALGHAAVSDCLNILLVGDLSFFYDMNALWNGSLRSNVRIVVLNNGGGAIFHALPGLDLQGAAAPYVTAVHHATAEGWARSQGFVYRKATDEVSLAESIGCLADSTSSAPVLVEVFTDAAADAGAQRIFYQRLKNQKQEI